MEDAIMVILILMFIVAWFVVILSGLGSLQCQEIKVPIAPRLIDLIDSEHERA